MTYFDTGRMSDTLWPACKAALTSPRALFAEMPATAGYSHSIVLLTIITVIGTLLGFLFNFGGFMLLFLLPFIWLFSLLSIWTWAAYLGWAVRTFTDQQLDTVNAFQLATYASMPLLFGFLPLFGLIANLWSLYLTWVALVARVQVKDGVALMIIIVPILILILSLAVLVILLFTLMPQMQDHMQQMMQF